jgi:DNA-binding HxlR family transcriptional regulator
MSRTYSQYCGVAHALDLVGERWALLVIRELVLGPKRFTDLKAGLPGVGTNILAARLRELEEGGVIQRRRLPPPAASTVYELTAYGRELRPALLALGRWGAASMGVREPSQTLRSEWLAVALTAFFRPEAAADLDKSVELRLTDGTYRANIDRGRLDVARADENGADLVLTTDEETLIGFLAGGAVPPEALAPEGDRDLLGRLPQIFAFGSS